MNTPTTPDNRPIGLKMGYEMMWSLLDDVSTEDMAKEIERLTHVLRQINQAADELSHKKQRVSSKLNVLKEVTENRHRKAVADEFKLTDEHRTLVSLLDFSDGLTKSYFNYNYEYLAGKLGWQKPNEYVSDEQAKKLDRLVEELPLAVNEILHKEGLIS